MPRYGAQWPEALHALEALEVAGAANIFSYGAALRACQKGAIGAGGGGGVGGEPKVPCPFPSPKP